MDDSAARTRAAYDRIGERFLENARDRAAFTPWFERLAADLPPGARVLDLGAGPGADSAELRRRGLSASAFDMSMGMLRAGATEFPGPRVQGDARRLPFASASLSGVWANASLLHFSQDEARVALGEITRVLRADGLLFITLKEGSGAEWESARYGEPRFFQYWSGPELDAALERAGFRLLASQVDEGPRNTWLVRLAARHASAVRPGTIDP